MRDPTNEELLKQFYAEYALEVRKGRTSGLSSLERIAISMFVDWLDKNYEVEARRTSNEPCLSQHAREVGSASV